MSKNEFSYKPYENNVINQYRIKNLDNFKNLKIGRYNIFNEVYKGKQNYLKKIILKNN